MRLYVDSRLNYTINESQVGASTWQAAIDHGFFILLNVALGGAYPNAICSCTSPTSSTTSGAAMEINYVAVYETGGSSAAPTTAAPTTTVAPTTTTVAKTTTVSRARRCPGRSPARWRVRRRCGRR